MTFPTPPLNSVLVCESPKHRRSLDEMMPGEPSSSGAQRPSELGGDGDAPSMVMGSPAGLLSQDQT